MWILSLLLPLALAVPLYGLMRWQRPPAPRKVAMLAAGFVYLLISGCSAIDLWASQSVAMVGY